MSVDIGPRIGIDGEKEFRQELQNINQQIRTLGSEMKAVTTSFQAGDRSQEALSAKTEVLTRQISAQEAKIQQLRKGLDAAAEKYGEADTKTLRWAQAVNDATADLNKMKAQLAETAREAGDLGDELGDLGDSVSGKSGGLGSLISGGGLGSMLLKGFTVGAVVKGVKELGSALFDLVDSTQEYRTIMASLEVSSQSAGYNAEQTAQTYGRLQSVLGDPQAAATATANLQAIGLSQHDLMAVTDAAIGAWSRYGDSIPIDGLAESINETIKAGTVTGSFADVLNWAGTSEDDFNAKLEAANSTSERANLVMQELSNQGLAQTGQAWIQNNQDIVKNNESTDKLNQAWARLGSAAAPLVANLRGLAADGLNFLMDTGEDAVAFFLKMPGQMKEIGSDIVEGLWNGIQNMAGWIKNKVSGFVNGIVGSVKGVLGIRSPSRVFRDEVGRYMAMGVGVGFTSEMEQVKRQMTQAMWNATPRGGDRPQPRYALGSGQSAPGNAGVGNVYLDRRKVGQIVFLQQGQDARATGIYTVVG